jgi:hypothetical protein
MWETIARLKIHDHFVYLFTCALLEMPSHSMGMQFKVVVCLCAEGTFVICPLSCLKCYLLLSVIWALWGNKQMSLLLFNIS